MCVCVCVVCVCVVCMCVCMCMCVCVCTCVCHDIAGGGGGGRRDNSLIPLLLSCGHNFCSSCLERMAKMKVSVLVCPTCQVSVCTFFLFSSSLLHCLFFISISFLIHLSSPPPLSAPLPPPSPPPPSPPLSLSPHSCCFFISTGADIVLTSCANSRSAHSMLHPVGYGGSKRV